MRSYVLLFVLLLCLPRTPAVKVQAGTFSYRLESVLTLKSLLEEDKSLTAGDLCHDSKLPEEFQPICAEKNAPAIFNELVSAVNNFDECEICAHPACPGCL